MSSFTALACCGSLAQAWLATGSAAADLRASACDLMASTMSMNQTMRARELQAMASAGRSNMKYNRLEEFLIGPARANNDACSPQLESCSSAAVKVSMLHSSQACVIGKSPSANISGSASRPSSVETANEALVGMFD